MIAIRVLIELQIQMLLLVLLGFTLAKFRLIGKSARQGLTNMSLYAIVPCNIIESFQIDFNMELFQTLGLVLLIASCVQLFGVVLSKLLYRGIEDGKRRILSYGTMVSNQGFMGLPIIGSVVGSTGLLYASIALIPLRIVMWTAALAQYTCSSGRKMIFRLLTHPCIIAVELGMLMMVFGIRLPGVLDTTVTMVGGCIQPIVMIALGSIFAEADLKHVISKELCLFTFVRLILIPGLVLLVLKLCRVDAVITAVTVIFAGMPAATTTAMLAETYGYDGGFAGKCTMVTTLLSLITITFWLMLI